MTNTPVPRRKNITWHFPTCQAWGIKLFTCITMIIQTIGIVVIEKGMMHQDDYDSLVAFTQAMDEDATLINMALLGGVFEVIGGLAVPLFVFMLVEGFKNTSNFKRYALAIFITALVSEIPYDAAVYGKYFYMTKQNPLFGMLIALLMLYFIKMLEKAEKGVKIVGTVWIIVCAILWVYLMRVDTGLVTVMLAAIFYLFDGKTGIKTILGIVVLLINSYGSLMLVSGIFSFYGIFCYNEKREMKCSKYVFYAIYPMQYIILGIIGRLIIPNFL